MNVKIQSLKFDADIKLVEFIENKMNKLDRFAERATSAEVVLRLDKDHDRGNKIATVTLAVPGDSLVAENRCKTFEEAVDLSVDALKKQLERIKKRPARGGEVPEAETAE